MGRMCKGRIAIFSLILCQSMPTLFRNEGAYTPLELEQQTFDKFFEKAVQKYSNNNVLAMAGETPISFREFVGKVDDVRWLLKSIKIQKGEKI